MPVDALIPYAHVADVERSIDFYGRLGLEVVNTHAVEGEPVWAYLGTPAGLGVARLMLARADAPVVASQQAVLFYCWTPDVNALRAELSADGVEVGEIEYPFYMPAGEVEIVDPDGYVILAGQLGEGGA